ncbi:rhomboid family intramembrane serine protease [Actinokineospora sp. G85]|uniref:rhomboid family intramembrane serine protease n=1 Tax=Actinokineospora sp. G85 TaxID=3406626 RepID=UPI003C732386
MTTPPQPGAGAPVCFRHPDRETRIRCNRCGKSACPDCLVDAAVGFQCVECVAEARRTTRRATTVAGAEVGAKPLLVPVLIAINVGLFAITAALASNVFDNQRSDFFFTLAQYNPVIAGGEWWRPLTAGFLHYGPLHVAVNMFSLWMLRDLELLLGKLRFAALYLLSLLGGAAAVYAFGSLGTLAVGASGAIYGLLGGMIVAFVRLKRGKHAVMNIVAVLGVNLAISISIPQISLLAHLGGLIAGALVTGALLYAPQAKRTAFQAGGIALVAVAIIGMFAIRTPQILDEARCTARGQEIYCYAPSGSDVFDT